MVSYLNVLLFLLYLWQLPYFNSSRRAGQIFVRVAIVRKTTSKQREYDTTQANRTWDPTQVVLKAAQKFQVFQILNDLCSTVTISSRKTREPHSSSLASTLPHFLHYAIPYRPMPKWDCFLRKDTTDQLLKTHKVMTISDYTFFNHRKFSCRKTGKKVKDCSKNNCPQLYY